MISDVLFHAVVEINRYLNHDTYRGELRERIVAVRNQMAVLQAELEKPPQENRDEESPQHITVEDIYHELGLMPSSLIGHLSNGTVTIEVLDDMGEPSEKWPEKRIAIEMSNQRMGLNRAELMQHILHCRLALRRFDGTHVV